MAEGKIVMNQRANLVGNQNPEYSMKGIRMDKKADSLTKRFIVENAEYSLESSFHHWRAWIWENIVVLAVQDYDPSWDEWGYVYVDYTITNAESRTIDYYEVFFEVTCADSSVYFGWDNGLHVPPGKTYSDWTIIDTAEKEAISVVISDYNFVSL